MPDFILIAVGSLVPICALTLALASGEPRAGSPAADQAFDVGIDGDDPRA
jgi:hypothetical protein